MPPDHPLSPEFSVFLFVFSSVQSLNRLGRRGDMEDDSTAIPFQSFLRAAIVGRSLGTLDQSHWSHQQAHTGWRFTWLVSELVL